MTDFTALDLPDMRVDPKKLFALKDDPYCISVLLNEFDVKGNQPFFSGLDPSTTPIPEEIRAKKFTDLASFMLEVYESFVWEKDKDKARYKEWVWTHAEQRLVLEKAIRILEKAIQKSKQDDPVYPEMMLWMGKAYLYRSRIIRPKGFTIPAKKTEALFKALEYFRSSKHEQAVHYAGLVALDLDRCGKPTKNLLEDDYPEKEPAPLQKLLNAATDKKPDPKEKERVAEFYQMRIRLEELENQKQPPKYDGEIFNDIFKHKKGLELEQFKIALLCKDHKAYLKRTRKILITQLLRSPFSHRLWENTVRFVSSLYSKYDAWKELAITLWKIAEKKSIWTTSVHLRWYWSRQRNLYDLAFLSAIDDKNFELAAEIADSAKSRPALTWQAMERMAVNNDDIRDEIRRNSDVISKVYIKKLTHRRIPKKQAEKNILPFPKKPDTSAIAVQFYLVHLHEDTSENQLSAANDGKNGYALIYDGKDNAKTWSCESFDFHPIWEKYLNWQKRYYSLSDRPKYESAEELKTLCEVLGEKIEFLFKLEQHRNMIFVPHDFLHRLPIHGAILKGAKDSILLEKFKCSYLPALSYARKSGAPKEGAESFLLQNFDPVKDKGFIEFFDGIERLFYKPINPAGIKDIEAIAQAKESPGFLTILCHGEADYINPFFSRLKLKEDVKLSEIAASEGKFAGTGIFLSACETDLTPPIDSPLDEHLSLASILLNKEASFVLGTMWVFYPDDLEELFSTLKENDLGLLFDSQIGLGQSLNGSIEKLYHGLCLKLYHYFL